MTFLLFIFYAAFFCWLFARIKFFKTSGLTLKTLIALFIIRIFFLLIGCYVNLYVLPISDSLTFHKLGLNEFNLLLKDPGQYFLSIFQNPLHYGYGRVLEDSHSYWNNLRTILLGKMLAVFDIFSLKNFWINSLFFNFLVFFGAVALYKVFIRIFPKAFYQLSICIFILPSALFYTAMIHRDGFIFLSLSMIIYHLYFLIEDHQFYLKRVLIILLYLILIFLLRNYVFITLVPFLVALVIALKHPNRAFLSFIIVFLVSGILFFCSGFLSPKIDFPHYVVAKQNSFIEVGKLGNSTIDIKPLAPNFKSFVNNMPQALDHSLLRPYPSKIKNWQYAPFALEILLMEILFFLFIIFRKKNIAIHPVIYFSLFFSITMMLIIGYTIPVIGALVRYRSIYLIFLAIPLTCYIDWKKVLKYFKIKNR